MKYLEAELGVLVKDLQRAMMNRRRDPGEAWLRIEHALEVAAELKRRFGEEKKKKRHRDTINIFLRIFFVGSMLNVLEG